MGESLTLPACPVWTGSMKQHLLDSTSVFRKTEKKRP